MWLSPHKICAHYFDFCKTPGAFDAKGEQFPRLQIGHNPGVWRLHPSPTAATKENVYLLWNSLRNVYLASNAIHTHVSRVGLDRSTTHATEYGRRSVLRKESLHVHACGLLLTTTCYGQVRTRLELGCGRRHSRLA